MKKFKNKIQDIDVEREIEVKFNEHNKNFIIEDFYKNTIEKKTPQDFMNYFNQVFTNNSNLLRQADQLKTQLERIWIDVDQNEQMIDEMRPMFKKAKLMFIKEQEELKRKGKKKEKRRNEEQGKGK